jgi:hypothetical protein
MHSTSCYKERLNFENTLYTIVDSRSALFTLFISLFYELIYFLLLLLVCTYLRSFLLGDFKIDYVCRVLFSCFIPFLLIKSLLLLACH